MAKSRMQKRKRREEARNLVVVRVTCDDPSCDGACIPPPFRKQALPHLVVDGKKAPWTIPHPPWNGRQHEAS